MQPSQWFSARIHAVYCLCARARVRARIVFGVNSCSQVSGFELQFSVLLCSCSVLRACRCAQAPDLEKYGRNSNSELVEVYFAY